MRLLDLYCGAGGCSVGYHRAGFEVVGVDIEPQPNYPYALDWFDRVDWVMEKVWPWIFVFAVVYILAQLARWLLF